MPASPADDINHSFCSMLSADSAVLLPAMPNDGRVEQPSCLHILLTTSIMPSDTCRAQNFAVLLLAMPNDGRLEQPSCLHLLLLISTFSAVFCTSRRFSPLPLNDRCIMLPYIHNCSPDVSIRKRQPSSPTLTSLLLKATCRLISLWSFSNRQSRESGEERCYYGL